MKIASNTFWHLFPLPMCYTYVPYVTMWFKKQLGYVKSTNFCIGTLKY